MVKGVESCFWCSEDKPYLVLMKKDKSPLAGLYDHMVIYATFEV
jgi:hypothetical protein